MNTVKSSCLTLSRVFPGVAALLVTLGGCHFSIEARDICATDAGTISSVCSGPQSDMGSDGGASSADMATAPDMTPALPRYAAGITPCDTYQAVAQAVDTTDGATKKLVCLPKSFRTAAGIYPQNPQSVLYNTLIVGSLLGRSINGKTGNGTWQVAPVVKSIYIVADNIGATPITLSEYGMTQADAGHSFGMLTRAATDNVVNGLVLEPFATTKLVQATGNNGVIYALITYDPSDDSITATKPLAKGLDFDGTALTETGVVR